MNIHNLLIYASVFSGLNDMLGWELTEEELRELDAKWRHSVVFPRKKKKRVRKELLKRYAELNVSEKEVRKRFKQ